MDLEVTVNPTLAHMLDVGCNRFEKKHFRDSSLSRARGSVTLEGQIGIYHGTFFFFFCTYVLSAVCMPSNGTVFCMVPWSVRR